MQPKTKAIIFIIVSFLLGGICGVILSPVFLEQKPAPPKHHNFLQLFCDQLNLTTVQKAQVDSILCASKKNIDVHKKAIHGLLDSTRIEIENILTQEQKTKLEQLRRSENVNKKNEDDYKKDD
ncbi:MAG: hypothetical protein KBG83_02205 [Bacteroidetes bacterium]|nr:hypothetical protein [Bacteroidota bacterium]